MLARLKKILLIVFLTLLIWIWADLANDAVLTNKSVTVKVSQSMSRDLWVSLEAKDGAEIIRDSAPVAVNLKGPSARIDELKRDTTPLEVIYYPELVGGQPVQSGEYSVPVNPLVQENARIRKLGLTVESCKPQTIRVKLERLVPKQLKVVCLDENNTIVDNAKVEPAIIDMLVKDYWSGEKLKAYVKLTESQLEEARTEVLELRPYVEMDQQRLRYREEPVKVSLPSLMTKKQNDAVPGPRIGFVFNVDMIDKYKVELVETPTIVQYVATEKASEAYKNQPYHLLLDILPEDAVNGDDGQPKVIKRKLRYNFPLKFARLGEIEPAEEVEIEVSFRLITVGQ